LSTAAIKGAIAVDKKLNTEKSICGLRMLSSVTRTLYEKGVTTNSWKTVTVLL
jgi:hypothetical protein